MRTSVNVVGDSFGAGIVDHLSRAELAVIDGDIPLSDEEFVPPPPLLTEIDLIDTLKPTRTAPSLPTAPKAQPSRPVSDPFAVSVALYPTLAPLCPLSITSLHPLALPSLCVLSLPKAFPNTFPSSFTQDGAWILRPAHSWQPGEASFRKYKYYGWIWVF